MNEIKRAIAYFEDSIRASDEIIADCSPALQAELDEQKECFIVGVEALRSEAERSKGCEYCNSRFGIASHHINEAGLQAGTKRVANYCPMCGKRLEVEP